MKQTSEAAPVTNFQDSDFALIAAGDLEQTLGITTPIANSLIKALIQRDILVEMPGQQRGRLYSFARYLELFFS